MFVFSTRSVCCVASCFCCLLSSFGSFSSPMDEGITEQGIISCDCENKEEEEVQDDDGDDDEVDD